MHMIPKVATAKMETSTPMLGVAGCHRLVRDLRRFLAASRVAADTIGSAAHECAPDALGPLCAASVPC
jgi:hypothetical protein